MAEYSKSEAAATRQAVIDTAIKMSRSGLSPGRSGNVSSRFAGGMLITPTGIAYEELQPSDIVLVGDDGSAAAGQRKPSSEWRFHLAAYSARPDRCAVVHTHSLHATVIACTKRSIPAFHYMVAVAGGKDIPCVPYTTFGTEDLAKHVAEGLRDRDACLMASHGQIAIGETLNTALELAHEVEVLATQYYKLLALSAANIFPDILSEEAMAAMVEKFKHYGQQGQG
jgi:L-fuculose-phosphate aldolase